MFTKLILKNPRLPRLTAVKVSALADSGAVHLCIPERVRAKLRLEAIDEKVVTLANSILTRLRFQPCSGEQCKRNRADQELPTLHEFHSRDS